MGDGKSLDAAATFRFFNMWVNFVNTQRSNFKRSNVIGETGLAYQAARSVVLEIYLSPDIKQPRENTRSWLLLALPDFLDTVESEFANTEKKDEVHRVLGTLKQKAPKVEQDNKNEVE